VREAGRAFETGSLPILPGQRWARSPCGFHINGENMMTTEKENDTAKCGFGISYDWPYTWLPTIIPEWSFTYGEDIPGSGSVGRKHYCVLRFKDSAGEEMGFLTLSGVDKDDVASIVAAFDALAQKHASKQLSYVLRKTYPALRPASRQLRFPYTSQTSVLCVGQEEKEANEANEASARALEDTAVWYEGEYEKAEMKWVKAHIAANEYVCSGGLANMPFEECVEFDGEVTGKYEHTPDNEEVNENYARQTNQADEAFKTEVRTAWQAQWDRLSPEAKFHFESKHEGPASKPSHINGKGGLSFSVVPIEKLRPME
jgi:hypothetical protein